jgi:hypothetical protein
MIIQIRDQCELLITGTTIVYWPDAWHLSGLTRMLEFIQLGFEGGIQEIVLPTVSEYVAFLFSKCVGRTIRRLWWSSCSSQGWMFPLTANGLHDHFGFTNGLDL